MIRYAGIDLTLPTPELTALLDNHYATTDLTPFPVKSGIDSPPGCPQTQLGAPVPVRVNTLHWPTAPQRWAQGYFLASDTQLACIRNEIGGQIYAPFEMWDTTGANTSTTSTTTTTPYLFKGPARVTAQLAIIGIHPVFDVTGGQKLHLLSFVDRRYFWWYTAAPTTTPATWNELWTNALIKGGVGSTYRQIDTTPEALGKPSGRWHQNRWKGYQLPVYMDCAAQLIQARVVCRMDETVRVERPDHRNEDLTQFNTFATYRHMGGKVPLKELASRQPEKVTVVFFSSDDDECVATPKTQEVLLSDLVAGGTEIPLDDLCGYVPFPTTSTSTTTTTTPGCTCVWQFQYDSDGNLVLPPTPYESNDHQSGGCAAAPSPGNYPPSYGTPNSITVVSQNCDPTVTSTTTTTCAGTTTTPAEMPLLPEYGTETGVPETSVYLWADGNDSNYPIARRLAVDWYKWRLSQVEALFNSCVPWVPTGFTDSLVYQHDAVHFDTRIHRVPGGPDNVVAVGLVCEDPVGELPTTTTTACTGTGILVNYGNGWVEESNTCSCGCYPIYPKDCPPNSCARRTVNCGPKKTYAPICSTTTTSHVTTTPYCPQFTSTSPACPCGSQCVWYMDATRVPHLIAAGCRINPASPVCEGPRSPYCYTYDQEALSVCDELLAFYNPTPICGTCNIPTVPQVACSIVYTPCTFPTIPPVPPCTGGCVWRADPAINEWLLDYGANCPPSTGDQGVCQCQRPPANLLASDYACGTAYNTLCERPNNQPPDPCNTSTSTSTTAGGCGGNCKWYSPLIGDPWQSTSVPCLTGCACPEPLWESTVDCETAITACVIGSNTSTSTSSTSTSTTATTTTSACTGLCTYAVTYDVLGNLTNSVLIGNTCSVGCNCPHEPYNGATPIDVRPIPGTQFIVGSCYFGTAPTTTTGTSATTTTGACGGICTVNVIGGVIDSITGCTNGSCGCFIATQGPPIPSKLVRDGEPQSCPFPSVDCTYYGLCV